MTCHWDLPALSHPRLIDDLTTLIWRAATAVLAIDQSAVKWRTKADLSPVSAADEAADAVITEGLTRLLPGLPIVSEEQIGHARAFTLGRSFTLVDPLDGTREYLAGRDEFTVNIAIILDGRPVVGLVAAPALRLIWRGVAGRKAERLRLDGGATATQTIRTREVRSEGFVAAVSRSHFDAQTDAFLKRLPIAAQLSCGSSLKFCRIAEGSIDVYARLAQTCEWDVAAGHAVLAAAGGVVTTSDGRELMYGRTDHFHIPAFIAWGDPSAARKFFNA